MINQLLIEQRRSLYHCVNCRRCCFLFIQAQHIPFSVGLLLFGFRTMFIVRYLFSFSVRFFFFFFFSYTWDSQIYSTSTYGCKIVQIRRLFKMFMQSNENVLELWYGRACAPERTYTNRAHTQNNRNNPKQQENSISRRFQSELIVFTCVCWCDVFYHFNDRNRNKPFANGMHLQAEVSACVCVPLPNTWQFSLVSISVQIKERNKKRIASALITWFPAVNFINNSYFLKSEYTIEHCANSKCGAELMSTSPSRRRRRQRHKYWNWASKTHHAC